MPAAAPEQDRALPVLTRQPPRAAAGEQDTLPSRYGWPVQLLALAAFTLAFVGWLNETWLFLFDNPIWLNRYTEYAIILGFGLWRIVAEKNAYTRRRLVILVAVVTGLWWLIPWLTPFFEPHLGYLWSQPVFPALHVPGTLTFFLTLALVFLFGRRVICGFGCPCVGIRETVGFPFRARTPRSKWAWRLRHSKWLFFVYYAGVLVVTQFPPNSWTVSFVGGFYLIVALTYFGSFFLSPLVGNRFYCRYLCPFGATFGLINHAGFYDLRMDAARCIDCGRCDQACDMGIPVRTQGRAFGQVTGLEDCMGCARCVVACPTDALEIRDVRNRFLPGLRRDASHLLRRGAQPALSVPSTPVVPVVSAAPVASAASAAPAAAVAAVAPAAPAAGAERRQWETLTPAAIRVEAARCLDCGEPACRRACPLHNRIPEWLALAARGRLHDAADLMHVTSPLPEICGALCPHHRLCEGACARTKQGQAAVAIGALEHAVVEAALADGWRPSLAPVRRTAKRAAVVGAGPAGLAFADAMHRAGWQVTVLDRHPAIGGLLATGLPPFRIDKAVLGRRRQWLAEAGVQFELGVEVDAGRFSALLAGHDAVFLGLGAQAPREVPLPGRELAGVIDALAYLAEVNRGEAERGEAERGEVNGRAARRLADRHVLVLGGGETALDSAHAAIRDGARSVTVAYRGHAEQLRASAPERAAAERAGVRFLFRHVPLACEGEGTVQAVRFGTGETGETGGVACEAVIVALGQRAAAPAWLSGLGIAVADGVVTTDGAGRTSHPRVFAGGDCAHGPQLIVTAAAAGRRTAVALLARQRRPWYLAAGAEVA